MRDSALTLNAPIIILSAHRPFDLHLAISSVEMEKAMSKKTRKQAGQDEPYIEHPEDDVAGSGFVLHDGWIHSCITGIGDNRGTATHHTR